MIHIIHEDALKELRQAAAWYEDKAPGQGRVFEEQIEEGIAKVVMRPLTWPICAPGFRRYLIKQFPYAIIYCILGDSIRVVAVMHLSRKPGYYLKRRWP